MTPGDTRQGDGGGEKEYTLFPTPSTFRMGGAARAEGSQVPPSQPHKPGTHRLLRSTRCLTLPLLSSELTASSAGGRVLCALFPPAVLAQVLECLFLSALQIGEEFYDSPYTRHPPKLCSWCVWWGGDCVSSGVGIRGSRLATGP